MGKGSRQAGSVTSGQGLALRAGSVEPGREAVYGNALAVGRASVSRVRGAPGPSPGPPASRGVASGSTAGVGGAFGRAVRFCRPGRCVRGAGRGRPAPPPARASFLHRCRALRVARGDPRTAVVFPSLSSPPLSWRCGGVRGGSSAVAPVVRASRRGSNVRPRRGEGLGGGRARRFGRSRRHPGRGRVSARAIDPRLRAGGPVPSRGASASGVLGRIGPAAVPEREVLCCEREPLPPRGALRLRRARGLPGPAASRARFRAFRGSVAGQRCDGARLGCARAPRPATDSRLRTGADKGIPTV